jgi:hypothetical protein
MIDGAATAVVTETTSLIEKLKQSRTRMMDRYVNLATRRIVAFCGRRANRTLYTRLEQIVFLVLLHLYISYWRMHVHLSHFVIVSARAHKSKSSYYDDKDDEITLTRRIVRTLSQFSWYCPPDMRNALDDAWAYFEHSTLPRYHYSNERINRNHRDLFPKAEPGEKEHPTRLYPVMSTPETELADFGVGVAVYFFTLRSLSIVLLVAGVLSAPNMYYFWSDAYNPVNDDEEFTKHAIVRTSAVCTNKSWQACPNCTRSQWDGFSSAYDRYAQATRSVTDSNNTTTGSDDNDNDNDEIQQQFVFILVTHCRISKWAGIVSMISMVVVCISIYIVSYISRQREVEFDEAQQTASDYSIEILNPPHDAKDAEEWRTFLSQFGHVTSVTIVYENDELLRRLFHRRDLIFQLEALQPVGAPMNPHNLGAAYSSARSVAWYRKLCGTYDSPRIQKQIEAIDAMIESDLSHRTYHACEVFAIFETEKAQQAALKALEVPGIHVLRNSISALPEQHVFRGKHVLEVCKAPEPSSVRWQDLDYGWMVCLLPCAFCLFRYW